MNIVMAQLNPIIGDLENNTKKIIDIIENIHSDIDFLIFPETVITGYPCLDLLERIAFIDVQNEYLEKIKEATKTRLFSPYSGKFNVVIGAFSKNEGNGKSLYNSLYVFRDGKEILKYNKVCLPTYNIFDEYRHCEPGDKSQFLNQKNVMMWKGKVFSFLICEDALSSDRDDRSFYQYDPVKETLNCNEDMDYLITINASPSNLGKFQLRERIYKNIVKKYNITAVYVNQVGAQDEIIFDGQSFIMAPDGLFTYVCRELKEEVTEQNLNSTGRHWANSINYIKEKFHHDHLIYGLREFFHKQGFTKAVFGCSGGIDSAVIGYLASKALGPENVTAITIPSKISSLGSVGDSVTLCNNLGIQLKTFPIGDLFEHYLEVRKEAFGEYPRKGITRQNIQPKFRTMVQIDWANDNDALFLNCSNKSELTFGYGSISGDLEGSISVLGGIWKTDVFKLARYINKINGKEIIPEVIISKFPSAELEPGMKDTDSLPEYDIADCIGKLFIEQDHMDPEDIKFCQSYLRENSNKEEVEKAIDRIDRNQFKRNQFCSILRVNSKDFGVGRKYPIVHKYNVLKYGHPLLDLFN